MKRSILLIIAATVIVTSRAMPAGAAPTIQFEKTEYDFGQMISGQKSKGSIGFKNIGDKPLDITKIFSVCKCTKPVKASITNVPPGKSGKIEFTFDATGFRGKTIKRILVKTNDPAHEREHLTILAEVMPIAKLNPDSLNFGWLEIGSTYEATVTITPMTPKPFKILKVEPGEYASVRGISAANDGKGSYNLKVVVKAGNIETRVMEDLRIVTNTPGGPAVTLLVYGDIVDETPKDDQGS